MVDTKEKITLDEAKRLYRENGNQILGDGNSFVSLKNINKIYPNNVQAVFNFNLDVEKNDFVALVGPSGCGKSTTLRMIAGLEEISSGHLFIDNVLANYLESKDRDIAMVFQSYALYPQLNVYDNIAFGLNIRKMDKKEIQERVFKAADILDLGAYLDRKPKELSGGQMQRVALGRAIVRNAKLFLMDEPLSNLDAKLRVQMRSEIVRIHEQIGATTIYVTHDQTEAMTMATKIAVMSKGWVQQIGTPQEIYNNPKNIFVATFIGAPAMNIVDGTYDNGKLVFDNGYSITLSDEFVENHKRFYIDKITQLNRMLAQDDFIKMRALLVYDDIAKNGAERLEEFKSIVNTITDVHGANIRTILEEYATNSTPEVFQKIRKELLTFTKISSADLGVLHNAQVFKKDAVVEDKMMHYQKKKKKAKKAGHVNLNSTNIEFVNNLYEVARDLLANYEKALSGPHPIRFGIRPENIHLANECVVPNRSDVVIVNSDIVELMGSELLIHSKWNDANFISKISTGTLVKPHIDVELALDLDKVLLFDAYCGDTIK